MLISRNSRQNRKRSAPRTQQAMHQALMSLSRQIENLRLTTETKPLPSTRDPTRIYPRQDKIYTFTRAVGKGTVTAALAGVTGALIFQLDDLPGYTDFTSLFDQYRIIQVQVNFEQATGPFGPSTTATDLPSLHTAIDLDDGTAPSNTDELRQYQDHQVTPCNAVFAERTVNPRLAMSAYSGVFGSFAQAPPDVWLDSNSPSVEYYGVKWATSPVSVVSGSYVLYNIECTYVVQCKKPK